MSYGHIVHMCVRSVASESQAGSGSGSRGAVGTNARPLDLVPNSTSDNWRLRAAVPRAGMRADGCRGSRSESQTWSWLAEFTMTKSGPLPVPPLVRRWTAPGLSGPLRTHGRSTEVVR